VGKIRDPLPLAHPGGADRGDGLGQEHDTSSETTLRPTIVCPRRAVISHRHDAHAPRRFRFATT
jgi:hypothetical protein